MNKEMLENIAKALGIETDNSVSYYSIAYYGEYGLSSEEAEEYACRRLSDAIYCRIGELVNKIERLEKVLEENNNDRTYSK